MTEEALFTYEDLCSVGAAGIDGSSHYLSLPTLTELENDNEPSWQGFIPVNANTKQIQGNEIRTSGGAHNVSGHFVKYVSKDGIISGSNESSRVSENEHGNENPPVHTPTFHLIEVQANNSSPAAGASAHVNAKQITTAATATGKVRKPRGRKPKAVKEAEAAAAAAAAAAEEMKNLSQGSSAASPRNDGERIEYTPNVVVHHKTNSGHPQGSTSFTKNVSIVKQEMSSHGTYAHEKVSLERLASQDRMEVVARMNGNPMECNRTGPSGATAYHSASTLQSKFRDNGFVLGMSKHLPESGPTGGAIHVQGSSYENRSAYQQNYPRYGNTDVTSGLLNNTSQQLYRGEQQVGSKSRLDQFITNRISSVGAPKRSVVAPSLIQRNLGLYTQLTAPKKLTAQFDMENQKLSHEKWKQFPNPNLNQRSHASNGLPSEMGNRIYGNSPMQNLRKSMDTIRDFDKNVPNGHDSGVGLREEAVPNGLLNDEMMHQVKYQQGLGSVDLSKLEYEAVRNLQNNRRAFAGYGPNPSVNLNNLLRMQARIQDLSTKLCGSSEEIYNLKMKIHLLVKLNKNLAMRVNLAEDQSEILKLKLRENMRSRKYRGMIPSLNLSSFYDDEPLLGDDFDTLAGFNEDRGRTFVRHGDGAMIPDWKYQFDAVTQNQGDSRLGLRRQIEVDDNSNRDFTTLKREVENSPDMTPRKKFCASTKDEDTNEAEVNTCSSDSDVKLFPESKKENCNKVADNSSYSSMVDIVASTALKFEGPVMSAIEVERESTSDCGIEGTRSIESSSSPKSEKSACDTVS
ncbi:unnamed protein product [Orchesella dallaii]|uniref:Uncharacterized protein n=1 Tax=Orchesella dallaii TaxID=48710 RepID=A0ABP1S5R8_9HEXA